jgi:hypothetical protein
MLDAFGGKDGAASSWTLHRKQISGECMPRRKLFSENTVALPARDWNKSSMRYALFAAALALGACATSTAPAQAQCLPAAGFSRANLDALKTAEWALPDEARRNALARALTACLSDPDPTLRDGIAFEANAHWMRARQLSTETMLWLADDLEPRLIAPEGAGFERPFAALVLSEVARADRIEAYMTPERRAQLLDAAIGYFISVRDYRGYDDREGWRHGVAHGSDLLLQLTLNTALERPALERIRDAIAAQAAPSEHAYVFGESERMIAPILYMAGRNVFSEAEWTAWLAQIAAPAPFTSWDGTFSSEAMLRKRHNATAFLMTLYVNAQVSQSTDDDVLMPGAVAALRSLP